MKTKTVRMHIDKWERIYKPVPSYEIPDMENVDVHHVWTLIADDEEGMKITNGIQIANEDGYYVTEKAWEDGENFWFNMARHPVKEFFIRKYFIHVQPLVYKIRRLLK